MRRCGSGRVAGIAQNMRGAEGRCDSVRAFCEAGEDRAFTASQRISSGWWGRMGVEGKDEGATGRELYLGERTVAVKMTCVVGTVGLT